MATTLGPGNDVFMDKLKTVVGECRQGDFRRVGLIFDQAVDLEIVRAGITSEELEAWRQIYEKRS